MAVEIQESNIQKGVVTLDTVECDTFVRITGGAYNDCIGYRSNSQLAWTWQDGEVFDLEYQNEIKCIPFQHGESITFVQR